MKNTCLLILCLGAVFCLSAQSVAIYDRPVQTEPSHSFDVLHYRIALQFEGKNRAFEGKTTIRLRSLADNFRQISLHAESYEVRNVRLEDREELAFQHKNGQLEITLKKAIQYNDTLSLVVSYGTNNFQVDPTQFGMGAGYPLGIGFFEATDDQPFLFNAYSFPTGARHWFPCYDHPHDRASHETIITTVAGHRVLANGILQSTTVETDGRLTYHWRQNQPHPTYLYNFVSGPYEVIADRYQEIPVNYWVYQGDRDRGLRSFHRTPEVLGFFEDYYGVKYPWDKYDQVIVPGIGGGAEATTATLIGASTLHDERAEPDFPSHWLIAHEAAHHWWGDFVSYRDWKETWLSESFATFSEYLYSNHLYGPEEGVMNLLNKRDSYLNEAKDRYIRPIVFERWEYPNQNFDRHTYQKGALVLHMLRDYLGERIFKKVLNHFLTTHAYKAVGTADFLKSIWEVTGQNMDWFFDQWIESAGHPVLDIQYEWKNDQVILTVHQIQELSDQVPVFTFPVKVSILTDQKEQVKTVWVKQKSQTFYFPAETAPNLVQFDPENVILKEWTFKKPKKELVFQSQNGALPGRIWAIQQLAEHAEDETVTKTLTDIARTGSFWALRKEALVSLGKNQQSILLETLQDDHSQVRTTAITLLGDTQQETLRKLFKDTFEKEGSYLVQAACIRALGKLKSPSDQAFFEEILNIKSPRNILKRAANWSLTQLVRTK